MSMTLEKALDRVRKLLAMADASSNENEAAQAADRAHKLMREYQLTEATVRLKDSTAKAEAIVENFKLEGHKAKKRVAWKGSLAYAVAKGVGAVMWWHGADIVCFGRESAVQTWNYTTQYLIREIDRLCEEAWGGAEGEKARDAGFTAKAWKNSFRMGAANRIAARMREQTAAHKREQRSAKAHVAISNANLADLDGNVQPHVVSSDTQALALIEKDEAEVETAYAAKEKREKFTRVHIGTVRSRTGYDAGREAADNVSLRTNRAGLPRGQARIGKED